LHSSSGFNTWNRGPTRLHSDSDLIM
jgi:hypothetical protein